MIIQKLLIFLLCLCCAGAASAQSASPPHCSFEQAHTGAFSVLTYADGSGKTLASCYAEGGALVDATITVTVRDSDSQPVAGYPAEDVWLQVDHVGGAPAAKSGLATRVITCNHDDILAIADETTDASGHTTISGSFNAGGHVISGSGGHYVIIMVGGWKIPGVVEGIRVNSPDMNGDHTINVADISIFAPILFSNYNYAADFNFDGAINVVDVSLLAAGQGATCP